MKKILTLILIASSSLLSFAQSIEGPVVEGTYLPVRGTSVKEVWNKVPGQVSVPYGGADTTWDYSGQSAFFTDTFLIKTFHPDSTPVQYNQYFGDATHASFLRTPFDDLTDSLYSYYIIDTNGLHMIGGFSVKDPTSNTYVGYDTVSTINPMELYVPDSVYYNQQLTNISRYTTYGKFNGFPLTVKGKKIKHFSGEGYGTLTMPDGSVYTDVVLGKIDVTRIDTIYINGSLTTINTQEYIEYSFLRNNTFGSSSLMYFNVTDDNDSVKTAWYTLPVDCGSLTGMVYKEDVEIAANLVDSSEAYLYRENSNFSKNDILATTQVMNGTYTFNNIPYGEYRIAVRPKLSLYPNALTTYISDTTDWLSPTTAIHTNSSLTTAPNIHIQYHPAPNGSGIISGNLNLDWSMRANNPIPGVDVVVKKKPSGNAFRETKSDVDGNYSLSNLDDGDYEIHVDIPGLHMAGTYDFTILGGTIVNCLNFSAGNDSIHPTCIPTGLKQYVDDKSGLMKVYPNPYSFSTTINLILTERSNVLLEVYNLLGERVAILDQGQKNYGTYTYSLNADNFHFSSGIYLLKLTANKKIEMLKVIKQ